MTVKTKRISTLIESQLPEFISTEYEMFSKFVQKYYESQEVQGGSLDIISNIQKYLDIDYYEKNLLKQNNKLTSAISSSDTTLTLEDASSFPEKNGYVKINDEIIFYKSRNATQLLECSRGVSGNNTLGDLYNESNFVTTVAAAHATDDKVYNISNLFLYAFVKNFESQYLGSFPEKYLKGDIDKRTLIKNIQKFYQTKGTESSIKFIFNSLIEGVDNAPTVYNPRDYTLKSSNSDWVTSYTLKVKIVSGNINDLIGNRIIQNDPSFGYASAVVDNIGNPIGSDSQQLYEVILNPTTINGEFRVASRSKLEKEVTSNAIAGEKVTVESTMGWKDAGSFTIGTETFTFEERNAKQFYIKTRSSSQTHGVGSYVYDYSPVKFGSVEVIVFGVLYELNPSNSAPYSLEGDRVQISESGFNTSDRVIYDSVAQSVRWHVNTTLDRPSIATNSELADDVADTIANIAAIYEDDQYYYICSSGYPSYDILSASVTGTLSDTNNLKIIRKNPISTTEIYKTTSRDVGVFVDGTLAFSHKDTDFVRSGKLVKTTVTNKGSGYKKAPYVLINNQSGKAVSTLSGETVNSITITTDDVYTSDPEVTITSGRNGAATALVTNGEITKIVVDNPGEYYSSPPIVRIFDSNGRGNFAEYQAVVSDQGAITDFVKINGGRLYTASTVSVTIIPQGSDATGTAEVRKWVKNRYKKLENLIDNSGGYIFDVYSQNGKKQYGIIANPLNLRAKVGDNLNNALTEPSTKTHSKILGYAYDGNPIYGSFGYSNPGDPQSSIVRLESGYTLNSSRSSGPSVVDYPLGTFTDDYTWNKSVSSGKTSLDENNGRYCVTPEYPEGTYAYFITTNNSNQPVYPYILGESFYSLPVSSNYSSDITQTDIPRNVLRLRVGDLDDNGYGASASVASIKRGSVTSAFVGDSPDSFSVESQINLDSYLLINNRDTGGEDVVASVSEIFGRNITAMEAVEVKPFKIVTSNDVYFFNGDTITQSGTNATGTVVGDTFNKKELVVRSTTNNFNTTNTISSNRTIIRLLLDKPCTFTKGSILTQTDGTLLDPNDPNDIAITGRVLETTFNQNAVKLEVLTESFIINDDYIITSNNTEDTSGSRIISISSLSKNIDVFSAKDNIVLIGTEDEHRLSVNDIINIDVETDDTDTETTYYIRKRKYQTVRLEQQTYTSIIKDTGIGRIDTLIAGSDYATSTYGGGTFTNVEILFSDITASRNSLGQTVGDVSDAIIGKAGASNNAKATVTVGYTINVTSYDSSTNTIVVDDATNVFTNIMLSGQNLENGTKVLSVNKDTNTIVVTNDNSNSPITGSLSTIVVNPGVISSVVVTSKGSTYRRGDTVSFDDTALDKGVSTTARDYLGIVDHVGFSIANTELFVNSVSGISQNDLLKIGEETVKVTSVDSSSNKFVVIRGWNNSTITDHFNSTYVSLFESEFRFTPGLHLFDQSADDPFVKSYDKDTRILTLYFNYNQNTTNTLNLVSVFNDQSVPAKSINIAELIDVNNKFEYSTNENSNFEILQSLELQRNYSYKFITSHTSMTDTFFEISPSINRNIVALDSFRSNVAPGSSGSFIKLAPGRSFAQSYGLSTIPNSIDGNALAKTDPLVEYNTYYFFDKNNNVDVSNSQFNVVDDPLQGNKKIIFTSNTFFAYEYNKKPQYDGHGSLNYSTTNRFAIGRIKSVKIDNEGRNYFSLPSVFGVVPNKDLECLIDVDYSPVFKKIIGVSISQKGSNYVNPKAVVIGDGSGGEVEVIKRDGSIVYASVKNPGSYKTAPTIKVVETATKIYLNSNNIGIPESVKIENSGFLYTMDSTLSRNYNSYTMLELDSFDEDRFSDGAKVLLEDGGVTYASGTIAENGWKKGSNIMRLKNITGNFIKGLKIKNVSNNSEATIEKVIVSNFTPGVKSYLDNFGFYKSEKGQLSSRSQKITDSYFYQDFSYVIKSRTPINVWRNLIKETTHPAGFRVFGEVTIDSLGVNKVQKGSINNFSIINLEPKQVLSLSSKKVITNSFVKLDSIRTERGLGSVSIDNQSNTETYASEVIITSAFDGSTKTFLLQDKNLGTAFTPYNEQELLITIDGVIQEPGVAYTVSGSNITFSEAPLGPRTVDSQIVPAQKFYGRTFKYKNNTLNQEYLKKIRNFFQRNGRWIDSANQIKFNRTFIIEESIGYVKEKYPTITWNRFEDKCSRDIGLFIDALEHDLRFGGNFDTISAAESYYDNGSVDHITDQLTESLDAFKYAAKLCAASVRNWDYTVTNAVMAPGGQSNVIQVDSTFGIVIGMDVSSGSQYPDGTTVTEIISDTQIKVSNNISPYAATPLVVASNTTVTLTQDRTAAGVKVEDPGGLLNVGANAGAVTLTSVQSIYQIPQATFSLSKINDGTFYDASNLIEKNKQYIQEETLGWVKAQYPSLNIPNDDKCKRDTGYLVDAVVYSLRYGGTRKIVDFAKSYYDGNKLKHINNELTESIAAYNHAFDLMILAMRNLLPAGTYTNVAPFTDSTILPDPDLLNPKCIQVESTLDSYSGIVSTLLGQGIGLIQPQPENNQRSGNWTNLKTYSNFNIIADSEQISYPDYNASAGSKECDDVVSSLSSLYEGVRSVLENGVSSVTKTNADYIDGKTKEFELYYENSTLVKTDPGEDLLVFLNGVIQLPGSYSIIRSDDVTVPDKISFADNLKWEQNLNAITVQEPFAIDKTFIIRIGSYEKLTINEEVISGKPSGPFLIYEKDTGKARKVDNDRYAYVFVDGVLQRDQTSYNISGSTITFKKPLKSVTFDNDIETVPSVDILVFYGRDIDKQLTFYNFEPNTYYNKINFTLEDNSTNNVVFDKLLQFLVISIPNYNLSTRRPTASLHVLSSGSSEIVRIAGIQKIGIVDNVNKKISLTLSGGNLNPIPTSGTLYFVVDEDFNNSRTLSIAFDENTSISFNYETDSISGLRVLPRISSPSAYESTRSLEEWNAQISMLPNLKVGDIIKIDGESDTREIKSLPDSASSTEFREGKTVDTSMYAKVSASNYNGEVSGVGLGIISKIVNGSVSELIWNKRDYSLLASAGILDSSTASGYLNPPIINFIPVDNNGGGAKAEVLVVNGFVVDIIITDPGSGYTQPPNVVVSRGYDREKVNRKIDYYITFLSLSKVFAVRMSPTLHSSITVIDGGYVPNDRVTYSLVVSPVNVSQEISLSTTIETQSTIISSDREIINIIDASVQDVVMVSETSTSITSTIEPNLDVHSNSSVETFTTSIISSGVVDRLYNNHTDNYGQNILGNRLRTLESFKFINTGYNELSKVTIEEWTNLYPGLILGGFDNPDTVFIQGSSVDIRWNTGYPSINELGSLLQIALNTTGNVVYIADTTAFPSSGKLLIGSEIISYTGTLNNDRFTGVTRGIDGTTASSHSVGDYLRTI